MFLQHKPTIFKLKYIYLSRPTRDIPVYLNCIFVYLKSACQEAAVATKKSTVEGHRKVLGIAFNPIGLGWVLWDVGLQTA